VLGQQRREFEYTPLEWWVVYLVTNIQTQSTGATMSVMRRIVHRCTYKLWRFFGGGRTEEGFRQLSDSIISNRKLISELRTEILLLQRRVWTLEPHTIEESVAECEKKLASFEASVIAWAPIAPDEPDEPDEPDVAVEP